MKRTMYVLLASLLYVALASTTALAECCIAPDNGSGTVTLPAQCPYDNPWEPMMIIDGLPPGTTIELHGPLSAFVNTANFPGGTMGGEVAQFDAVFEWELVGTGDLAGYFRTLFLPVSGEIHFGPRNPGDPVQSFDAVLFRLQGQLVGDPDFDFLAITAGEDYGLPGPGHTNLYQLPDGDFAVDSFFDITYQIEFVGAPGSILDGLSGTTPHVVQRETCPGFLVDWARLQWPHTIEDYPGAVHTVYGRLFISGVTDQTQYNDPIPGVILAEVGYGPEGTDPSSDPSWVWTSAYPNPAWDGAAWGEPANDEYMADLVVPSTPGVYDYCYRFSGNKGYDWTYADIDDTNNGYQSANAGKMTVLDEDVCCWAPDNGTGTIDFPPDCPYDHPSEPMKIIDALPPGDTIELAGPIMDFLNVVNLPGGSLGGEICTFDATIDWTVSGTGSLTGFSRHLSMPVTGEMHIGPRNPGDPVQSFDALIFRLDGELFGDPDFCTLRIRAGDFYGLPGPGFTTLTDMGNGGFEADSFFDVTYQIEFEGCPGSQLEDYAGITTDTVPRLTCYDATYPVDWCRLQWPPTIEGYPGAQVTTYGRFYIAGLTDQSPGNDPVPGIVRVQIGYFGPGSDPFDAPPAAWTEMFPNPGWDGVAAGEPNNDEYMADLTLPASGNYDYCIRVSGDAGSTWLLGDLDTGAPGEDGSENGYQSENAGKMTVYETCCEAPDNGTGTIDFPPDCPYDHPDDPMKIIDGLPPGDTIELAGPIMDFLNVVNLPGGSLGGEICTFDATIDWTVSGTGSLTGFSRHLSMPVTGEMHIGPRNPGDPVQIFETLIFRLDGELFGDPDFCTLRILAGNDYGLPCPGQTELTQLPSGDFAVDSFFDITYQIEFEGCPGSQLEDYMGTTTDTVRRTTCWMLAHVEDEIPVPETPTRLLLSPVRPNPFAVSTEITYAVPSGAVRSPVTLNVYDVTGRRVRSLVNADRVPGIYHVSWDGRDENGIPVASGIYFCWLRAGGETTSRRMVLLR